MRLKRKRFLYLFIGFILLIIFFYYQNNAIVTSEYYYRSNEVPKEFNGYKIVQLSDLHSKLFGSGQKNLVKKVKSANPDLIISTGDLIDSKNYSEENSLLLMEQLVEIAPVYFVTGNHEGWSRKFSSLESELIAREVKVMRNSTDEIVIGEDMIRIIGIDDPALHANLYDEKESVEAAIRHSINENKEEVGFTILLSHRPELISTYSQFNIDLVFSGHAHGGQFRFPFIGGLIAPNQGFLPTYTAGEYTLNKTTMIVNRGLGNSIIPLRIFNRPEIVVLQLEK